MFLVSNEIQSPMYINKSWLVDIHRTLKFTINVGMSDICLRKEKQLNERITYMDRAKGIGIKIPNSL